jgi:phage protein D/phage baseplate assembly protein gpV
VRTTETLPYLRVEVDGVALDEREARALAGVTVMQRLSCPAVCELLFIDPVGALQDPVSHRPGAALRVTVGDGDVLFDGELTGVVHRHGAHGEWEVRLRALDRLHRLRKRQPVRAHVERRLPEIARDLVADLGLEVRCDDAGPVWQRHMQYWQSDLEVLSELCERCGRYFVLEGDVLHLLTLEGDMSADVVELRVRRELLEVTFDASAESGCDAVAALGWDPWLAADHEARPTRARTGRDATLDPVPGDVRASSARTLADLALQSDAQAALIAQAELDRRAAAEVVVEGVAAGDARLRPGRRVRLRGVAKAFEGQYVIAAVTHTIDRERGFRSELDTRPAVAREPARGAVATVGCVIDVSDPDGLGRVRVTLPSYAGIETDWLEVLSPGAGAKKGIVALPDVGDRVLLLLPRQDPAQALVLGGLYGSEAPPDAGVEDGRIKRYTFTTPRGQRIQLDDDKSEVRVQSRSGHSLLLSPSRARIKHSGGSYVELLRDSVKIHAEGSLEIAAPGHDLVFTSAKVDFRTG